MKILRKYIHRQLLENRTQSFLSILSLTIAIAFLCTISTLGLNTYDTLTHSIIDMYGDYHAKFTQIEKDFVNTLNIHGSVDQVSLVQKIATYPYDLLNNPEKNQIQVLGFTPEAFDDLQIQMISGRKPVKKNEIIVSDDSLYHGKINAEIDQYLELDNKNKYKVVGIFEIPFFDMESQAYSMITTYQSNKDYSQDAFVTFKENININKVINRFEAHFNEAYDEVILNSHYLTFTNFKNKGIISNTVLTIILFVYILFLGFSVLLIRNSFKNSYANREKHLAILKTIGVTQKQCQHLVLYEGLVLLMIALFFGVILGVGLTLIFTFIINVMLSQISVNSIEIGYDYLIPCVALSSIFTMLVSYITIKRSSYKIIHDSVSATLQTSEEVIVENQPYLELNNKASIFQKILLKNIRQNKILYQQIIFSLIGILSLFIFLNGSMGYLRDSRIFDVDEHNYDVVVKVKNESYPTRLMTQLKQVKNQKSKVIRESLIIDVDQKNFTEDYLSHFENRQPMKIQLIAYSDSVLEPFVIENHLLSSNEFFRLNNTENPLGILINQSYSSAQLRYYDILEKPTFHRLTLNKQQLSSSLNVIETDHLINGCTYVDLPQVIVSQKVFDTLTSNLQIETHQYEIFYQSSDPKSLTHELSKLVSSEKIDSYEVKNAVASFEKGKSAATLVRVLCYGFIICLTIMGTLAICCISTTNFEYRKQEFALYRVLGLRLKEIRLLILAEYSFYALLVYMASIAISTLFNVIIYYSVIENYGIRFFVPLNSLVGTLLALVILGILIVAYSSYKIKNMQLSQVLKNEISLL